jgi:hypothetical protein
MLAVLLISPPPLLVLVLGRSAPPPLAAPASVSPFVLLVTTVRILRRTPSTEVPSPSALCLDQKGTYTAGVALAREVAHFSAVIASFAASHHLYLLSFRRFPSSWNSTLICLPAR